MEMQVSREIQAPSERVWTILTDLEGSPATLSGVERVERLDGGDDFAVGTRWRETRVMFGREAAEEMEVTGLLDGRSYTVTADGGNTNYTSVLLVEPLDGERCRLSMSFSAAPSGIGAKLLGATVGRLFQKATRRMLQRDLDDIAHRAEAAPAV